MRLYERGHISEHGGGGAGEAAVGGVADGAAPSPLVEGVRENIMGGQGGE